MTIPEREHRQEVAHASPLWRCGNQEIRLLLERWIREGEEIEWDALLTTIVLDFLNANQKLKEELRNADTPSVFVHASSPAEMARSYQDQLHQAAKQRLYKRWGP